MRKPPQKDPFLGKAFRVSLLVHGTLVLFLLLQDTLSSFFTSSKTEEKEHLKKAQIAKQAIRVDMVDLPRYTLQELSKIDASQELGENEVNSSETKEISPSENAMKFKNEEALKKARIEEEMKKKAELDKRAKEKLQAEEKKRLDDLRSRLRADSKRNELMNKLKGDRGILAGNKISKGYSQTGSIATDADEYVGMLRSHVHRNWHVPSWMRAAELKAIMLVKIAPDGSVVKKAFVKRSGNMQFDATVEAAIERADPFPAPPKALARMYMEEGFECGFPN